MRYRPTSRLSRICIALMLVWLSGRCSSLRAWHYCAFPMKKVPDVAVIFGNAVDRDGITPSQVLAARLVVAVHCYQTGYCAKFFVSGSIDGPGLDEASAMRSYLLAHGVPADCIIVDDQEGTTPWQRPATRSTTCGNTRFRG